MFGDVVISETRRCFSIRRCRLGAVCRFYFIESPLVAAPLGWLRRNSLLFFGFGFSCQRKGELRATSEYEQLVVRPGVSR
jgi:hypothetical protein